MPALSRESTLFIKLPCGLNLSDCLILGSERREKGIEITHFFTFARFIWGKKIREKEAWSLRIQRRTRQRHLYLLKNKKGELKLKIVCVSPLILLMSPKSHFFFSFHVDISHCVPTASR